MTTNVKSKSVTSNQDPNNKMDVNCTASVDPNSVARGAWLYRIIWRWHFYAGIFCIPFITVLATTGAIYLFKPQIDAWVDAPYAQLTPTETQHRPNQHIAAAMVALPDASFVNYQLPLSNTYAVIISLLHEGERTLVYIHPYTLEVLKVIEYEDQFIRIVRSIHGELLAGNVGSILVELAACWAIVLVVSGLYLWWPRSAQDMGGVLYPRLAQGGRVFWRDIHSVVGIWISFFVLFLLITALPWALVWGGAFKELRTVFSTAAHQTVIHDHANHHNELEHQSSFAPQVEPIDSDAQPDWTLSRQQERRMLMGSPKTETINLSQSVYHRALALDFAPPVLLSMTANGDWKVTSDHQNRPLRAEAWLAGDSGDVLLSKTFAERPLLDRAIGVGTAAHEGQLFGWFNQLLGLITALGLLVMSVSGFVMWRKRKPVGKLGAPKALAKQGIGLGITIITLALAVFLPLLAASLMIILLLEVSVLRFLPGPRRWLGLRES